jgi:simple sugar transport system substrate-binding protein
MSRKVLFGCITLFALLVINGLSVFAADDFVFGVIMVGPKNDRGWSQAHYEGGLRVEKEIPGTKMLYFEKLNTADSPQATLKDVTKDMIDKGAKLIITTSDEFQEDTDKVAADNPDVVFINTTGSRVLEKLSPPNVGNVNGQYEWVKLISGCAAALATKTGKIGYLGALINPETRRLAASSFLGARYCYEKYAGGKAADLSFNVTWIGFWFNIPGVTLDPTEESKAFFDKGADVVLSGIDTTEALVVAGQKAKEGKAVWAMTQDSSEGCSEAPDVCLGSPYYNWFPVYRDIVKSVQDKTWKPTWSWVAPDFKDINSADTSSVGFAAGAGLTKEQKANLDDFIKTLSAYGSDSANAQSIFLWTGPLKYQDGTVLAEDGKNVPLQDIWYLKQLLDGMTGLSVSK